MTYTNRHGSPSSPALVLCEHCGKEDPESLGMYPSRYTHECTEVQSHPPDPVTLCDECAEDHDPEADYLQQYRDAESTHVRYECGRVWDAYEQEIPTVQHGDEEIPYYKGKTIEHVDRIPVHCRCGAEIEEIL